MRTQREIYSSNRLEVIISRLKLTEGKAALLENLAKYGPVKSGNALARRTGMTVPNTRTHLKAMEKYGWVDSWPNPHGPGFGAGSTSWEITKEGKRILQRLLNA